MLLRFKKYSSVGRSYTAHVGIQMGEEDISETMGKVWMRTAVWEYGSDAVTSGVGDLGSADTVPAKNIILNLLPNTASLFPISHSKQICDINFFFFTVLYPLTAHK